MSLTTSNIVLSICIPTYNRARYLDETLKSITDQSRFRETNEIEIVISDNCSDDNTNEVSLKYVEIFDDKIRYYKNSENIKDKNFEKVLSYGKGLFLKLNNDTLKHNENSLDSITESIKRNNLNKDMIFFSNGFLGKYNNVVCNNLDQFVKTVSFCTTWIACFGIWKRDFDSFDDFSRISGLRLVQTDVLFRQIVNFNKRIYVDNREIYDPIEPESKGGYNIYEVFVTNYIGILELYKSKKQLSEKTFIREKTKLLRGFLIPWTLNVTCYKDKYYFNNKGALSIMFSKYALNPSFYISLFYLLIKILNYRFRTVICRKTV